MPRLKPADPLLAFGKLLTLIAMALLAVGGAASVIAAIFALVQQGVIAAALAEGGSGAPLWKALGAILAALALLMLLTACLFRFVQLLGRIIDTVGAGDPFIPANAGRLSQMAWLILASQAIGLLLKPLGLWLGSVFTAGISGESWQVFVDGDLSFSPVGVLLAVTLFILARVFRKGAEMRDDLEGTV